jgi:hypothetical protein
VSKISVNLEVMVVDVASASSIIDLKLLFRLAFDTKKRLERSFL